MEEKMTEVEKIIAGITNIKDYDISNDFDNDEIVELLEAKIIRATDLKEWRASNLIIDGIISYKDYPFERFSPAEQLRQLHCCAIEPAAFLEKADLDFYDADEWLFLLQFLSYLAGRAPWEMMRREGSEQSWEELFEKHPEFEKYAPGKGDVDNKTLFTD